MNRRDVLLRGITKNMLGIEIGPYHQPLVSKREGFRSLSLDVHDTDVLRKSAAADPAISEASAALIEDVDLVGSATKLAEIVDAKSLAGKLDYIMSSHNFKHIPDPIRFLKGCEKALKRGGVLSLALPDKSAASTTSGRYSFEQWRRGDWEANVVYRDTIARR